MQDLGLLHYFLCIKVAYAFRDYLLSQQNYVSDILDCATLWDPYLYDSPSVPTPMELNLKLRKDDCDPLLQPTQYRELVGALIYLLAT